MSQDALENAVNTAAQSMATEASATTEENQSDEVETSKSAAKEAEISKPDPRTIQALALLDALENPQTAGNVVKSLMNQLGIEPPETKKEEKAAERTIKAVLKEKMGDDFSFISDKLGDALEEILRESTDKVRSEMLGREAQRTQEQLITQYNSFLVEEKVSDEEAGALSKLVEEMPPSGKDPLPNYLKKLLKYHRLEAAETKSEIDKRQRQKENLSRRAEISGTETNDDRVKRGSGKISAREAVEAAVRGELLD